MRLRATERDMREKAKKSLLWGLASFLLLYLLAWVLSPRDPAFYNLLRRGLKYEQSKVADISRVRLSEGVTAKRWIEWHPDRRAFFLLLALRRDFPDAYEQ